MSAEQHFEAGMAMLEDSAASGGWQRAIELINSAATAGLPAAIECRALFECMGVGRAPDWTKALDSLSEAASRGSGSAQGQLDVVANRPPTELLRAPDAQTISLNPLIRTVPGFASPAECHWLIATAEPRMERAIIYSTETGEQGVDPGRTNQFALFTFVHLDVVVEAIRARIASAIGAPLPCLEVSQVLRYAPCEEFAPHHDFLDAQTMAREIAVRGQRAVTVLLYLNEEFEGGETSFPELGIEHRAKTGDALIFSNVDPRGQPDPRTRHAGRPPTSGEKWLFSQWVRDRVPA
jgi:prolyl 4-hydroxylase